MSKHTLMNAEIYDALIAELTLLKWMLGFNLVLSGGILWTVVRLAGTAS